MGLVLTRKRGAEIVIGDELAIIKVCEIKENSVKLMVTAKKDVPVWRKELYENRKGNVKRD